VTVEHGRIALTGEVESGDVAELPIAATTSIPGVRSVISKLRVASVTER
jgi:osmotically-inducible protein OsmY